MRLFLHIKMRKNNKQLPLHVFVKYLGLLSLSSGFLVIRVLK